jgi:putative MATE family efflux protein
LSEQLIVDHRNVGAAFRRLSLPGAISMLGDQLLSIVDTIVIGSLGAVALAGATAASAVFIAIAFGVFGLMSGGAIFAAQRVGARDLDGFGKTMRAAILIPFAVTLAIAPASVFFAAALVEKMVGPLPSAHAAAIYLMLRCAALIPVTVSGTVIVGLGAAGNRAIGIIILAIINAIHVPLVLILALGLFTHHPYGIVGAGISTLISECVAAAYAIRYVWRRPIYRIFSSWTLDLRLALRCAWLGVPEAAFLFAVMVPDAFLVAMLAPLGAISVAALRALNVVSDLTFVVPSPLQQAVQTVIGQRLGAGDIEGAKTFFVRARTTATWVSLAAGVAFAALAWPAAFLFTFNAQVASIAALPLAVHMATLPIKGWSMVSLAPIRAAGDTQFSMIIGIVTSLLVIPVSFLAIRVLHIGLWGVPLAWIAAWTARALITALKLRGESWTRRSTLTT